MAQKIEKPSSNDIKLIKITDIKPPVNPIRTKADEEKFEDLVESIKKYGLIHPIVVFQKGKMYEVIAGHRRLSACKVLDHNEIQAKVVNVDETTRDMIKLHENIAREDVNPFELALYFKSLIEKYGFKLDELADIIGRSRPYVSNILRILSYPDYMQKKIQAGTLTYNIASILDQIQNENTKRNYVEYAETDGLSQETARKWVDDANAIEEAVAAAQVQSENQEPAQPAEYHPPTCEWCGLSSRDVPLQAMLTCVRCKFDIREMIEALSKKES